MAQMKDSEGAEIPKIESRYAGCFFNITMLDWNDGELPDLSISVPNYFSNNDNTGEYHSEGCVTVPIRKVMDEYIGEMIEKDGGRGAEEFAKYIESYAEKLREKIKLEGYTQ